MSKKSKGASSSKKQPRSGSSALGPALCTAGCGFFGNPDLDGLCSKCYRDKKGDQDRASGSDDHAAEPVSTPPRAASGSKTNFSGHKAVSFKSNQTTPPSASTAPTSRPPTPHPSASKATPKLASNPAATTTTPKSGSMSNLRAKPKVVGSTPVRPSSGIEASTPSKASSTPTGPLDLSKPTGRATAATTPNRTRPLEPGTPEDSPVSEGVKSSGLTETTTSTDEQGKSSQTGPESETVEKKPRKQKKQRCGMCPTSLAVIGFDCRCGRRFCVVHQQAEKHGCTFDYRAAGQAQIRKANPKVIADKIKRI